MIVKATDIKLIPVHELIKNPKNRNSHPKEQIERLSEIIKYQGFRQPLVVSNQTGMVIAGHGRLEAAIAIGMKSVPVIYQDFDSTDQEISFGVSDNAIASWAELDLAGINCDLADLGPDFDINNLGIKDFTLDPGEADFPELSAKDPDFQQRTFVLSNEQSDILDEALEKAKQEEDCSDDINQNSNGNTLIAALKRYVHG